MSITINFLDGNSRRYKEMYFTVDDCKGFIIIPVSEGFEHIPISRIDSITEFIKDDIECTD